MVAQPNTIVMYANADYGMYWERVRSLSQRQCIVRAAYVVPDGACVHKVACHPCPADGLSCQVAVAEVLHDACQACSCILWASR